MGVFPFLCFHIEKFLFPWPRLPPVSSYSNSLLSFLHFAPSSSSLFMPALCFPPHSGVDAVFFQQATHLCSPHSHQWDDDRIVFSGEHRWRESEEKCDDVCILERYMNVQGCGWRANNKGGRVTGWGWFCSTQQS